VAAALARSSPVSCSRDQRRGRSGAVPRLHLAGIRPSRLYRYFDGIWNSVLSPVGLSPLLLL